MRCVDHLVKEAGQDSAAGHIVGDLTKFLVKDTARPQSALSTIESDPALTALLPGVLIAGSQIDLSEYTTQTLRLARSDVPQIKRDAIFALSRLQWGDTKPPEEAFAALEGEQEKAEDDQLLTTFARTATALARIDTDQEARLLAVTDTAVTKGGEYSIHAAADILACANKDISTDTVDLLLKHLTDVNPDNRGTIDSSVIRERPVPRAVVSHFQGQLTSTRTPKARKLLFFLDELAPVHVPPIWRRFGG